MLGHLTGFLDGVTRATEKRIEFAGALHRREFVETTDMSFADEDLRNHHSATPLDHFIATSRLGLDIDLRPLDALGLQKLFGHRTIRATIPCVDHDRHQAHLLGAASGHIRL